MHIKINNLLLLLSTVHLKKTRLSAFYLSPDNGNYLFKQTISPVFVKIVVVSF
jgi:hypothetical protein